MKRDMGEGGGREGGGVFGVANDKCVICFFFSSLNLRLFRSVMHLRKVPQRGVVVPFLTASENLLTVHT